MKSEARVTLRLTQVQADKVNALAWLNTISSSEAVRRLIDEAQVDPAVDELVRILQERRA